ncbi:MAG TPA: TIGR03435 family protein, partial [Gemmatimonadales bacterium]|nr:TIGR03435 family protein [Gemmatimonadales bacterium]
DADRFDIEGAAGRTADFEEIRAMTRTVLEDRFKLRSHVEQREQPILVLTVARRDGRLGDDMAPAGGECKPITPPQGAPPPPPPPPGGAAAGGPRCPSMLGIGAISGRKLAMSLLVSTLANYLNRQIVDRTNLTGTFDLDLRWTPDNVNVAPGTAPFPVFPFDPNGPSLSTALQEQLGLKMESARGPVDVLAIDGAEKPTPD